MRLLRISEVEIGQNDRISRGRGDVLQCHYRQLEAWLYLWCCIVIVSPTISEVRDHALQSLQLTCGS